MPLVSSKATVKPAAAPTPAATAALTPSDGAIQILGILQRDGRLIDFLMEDIAGATDERTPYEEVVVEAVMGASLPERAIAGNSRVAGVESGVGPSYRA